MFGTRQPTPSTSATAAADLALIQGGGLVHVIVTETTPLTFYVFLNDKPLPPDDVESVSLYIAAPDAPNDPGTVRATLSHFVQDVAGARSAHRQELFPCTLEIVALGRRISVSAMQAGSLDGLWINLGLKPNGETNELSGLQSMTVLLQDQILHAAITWEDGREEELLPQ